MTAKKNNLDDKFEGEKYIKTDDYEKGIEAVTAKVEKCFSEDRFEYFQKKVKTIVLDTMGHEDGIEKIKKYGTQGAKEYIQQDNWEKLKFWIPTIISVFAIIVTIYLAFFKSH